MKATPASSSPLIEVQILEFLRRHWHLLTGIAAIVVLALWLTSAYQRSKPEYALKVLDNIHTAAQVEEYAEYLTPRGKDLVLWYLQEGKYSAPATENDNFVFEKPVQQGNVCTIGMNDGQGTRFIVQMVRDGGWRFDDIYCATVNGKKVELWASYIKDHPIISNIQTNWSEIGGTFIKGFIIGLGL